MKKIKCLDCDEMFEGETKEGVMEAMMPHYMQEHKDVMEAGTEEKKKVWFEKFNQDWAEAPEC